MSNKKSGPYHIVEAGWQSTKLRLISVPFICAGLVGLCFTPWLLTSLPNIDGELEPLSARIALASLVAFCGLLCTVGFWCYLSIYVSALVRDGDTVIVQTQGILWPNAKALTITSLRSISEHDGRLWIPSRVWVNAPFQTIAVEGWKLPLLIDDQSRYLDRTALRQIIRDSEMKRRRQAGTKR